MKGQESIACNDGQGISPDSIVNSALSSDQANLGSIGNLLPAHLLTKASSETIFQSFLLKLFFRESCMQQKICSDFFKILDMPGQAGCTVGELVKM